MRRTKLENSYIVRVPGFDVYNGKSNGKSQNWFRLDSSLFMSSKFLSLTSVAKLLWLWVLSEAAKSSHRECVVHPLSITSVVHGRSLSITSALNELLTLQWIQVLKYPYERTNERTGGGVMTVYKPEESPPQKNVENIQQELPVLQSKPVLQNASATKLFSPKNQFELIDAVPPDQLALWDALYTDREFLERETIKAFQYYKNNPKKTPKTIRGWRAALSSWFERGWVRHVTKIKSVSKNGSICGISYDV